MYPFSGEDNLIPCPHHLESLPLSLTLWTQPIAQRRARAMPERASYQGHRGWTWRPGALTEGQGYRRPKKRPCRTLPDAVPRTAGQNVRVGRGPRQRK
jgi:hypothetical protein